MLVLGVESVEALGEESVGAEPVEALFWGRTCGGAGGGICEGRACRGAISGGGACGGAGSSSSSQAEACSSQHQSSGRRLQTAALLIPLGSVYHVPSQL